MKLSPTTKDKSQECKNESSNKTSIAQDKTTSVDQAISEKKGIFARFAQPLDSVFDAMDGGNEEAESLSWDENADRARVEQNPVQTRVLFYALCLTIMILIMWSVFAEIDQVTRGEGKVIPSQQVQILQSLDGGVITDINVREGDIVETNELLVKLDATRFRSNLQESYAELLALKAKFWRLRAVVDETDYSPPDALKAEAPALFEHERQLFESTNKELGVLKNIANQQITQREKELVEAESARYQAIKSYDLASRELSLTRPLVQTGAVSEVELLRLEREISAMEGERDQAIAQISRIQAAIKEAHQKMLEVELNFKNTISEELSLTMSQLNVLEKSSLGLTDRVKQTAVRSPVRGTIKRLYYNTIGGVVLPGKEIIEIIPLDDSLLLEARINPQDIAFLHPGLPANVKFTAYDFVVYGGLDAVVEHIGADTVIDENGNPFYTVRVRTIESSLGEGRPIIPGMVASVDILTGKKTIMAYLLKPILRAKQYAMTER